jgi:hypothetical protein
LSDTEAEIPTETTSPAPTEAYRPLPEATEPDEDKKRIYDANDSDSIRAAALEVDKLRGKAEAEPLDRSYRWEAGTGDKVEPHYTLDAGKAAEDLTRLRNSEVAEQGVTATEVASAIDSVRSNYWQPQQPEQAQLEQPNQPPTEPQPEPVAEQTQQPADGVDPEVRAALENPKVRAALEAEVSAVETARQQYAQATWQAAQVSAAAVLSQWPELNGLSREQLSGALQAISAADPAKGQQITAQLQRTQALVNAHQQAQAQQQAIQAQQLQNWISAQDAEFDRVVSSTESPETMRKIGEDVIALAEEYGIDKQTLGALWHSQPILRAVPFQRMMMDAARYRAAQRNAPAKVAAKVVPPVQRPGTAPNRYADSGVESALSRFRSDPNPKSAAALLVARRSAKR